MRWTNCTRVRHPGVRPRDRVRLGKCGRQWRFWRERRLAGWELELWGQRVRVVQRGVLEWDCKLVERRIVLGAASS